MTSADDAGLAPRTAPLSSQELARLAEISLERLEPGDAGARVLTPEWLQVTLLPGWEQGAGFSRPLIDPVLAESPGSYTVTSADDPAFAAGLTPTRAGFRRRTAYAPLRETSLSLAEHVFLQLPAPLQPGLEYTVELSEALTGTRETFRVVLDPERFSPVLHVDPQGYRPGDAKRAHLGLWMGSGGELVLRSSSFEVLRLPDRELVHTGLMEVERSEGWRATFSPTPYEQVYVLDFSPLTESGTYVIRHAELGLSQPFRIAEDAHRVTLATLALGMYHQRCGAALEAPYTRFTHGVCHEDDAQVYESADMPDFVSAALAGRSPSYPTTLEGQHVSAAGGHHDAGDYGKYTYNGAKVVWRLMTLLDRFPQRTSHDDLGLPESGNGIPDLLDEALWEIRWLKTMQDPVDGGVFSMVKPLGSSYEGGMPDRGVRRYLAPKNTIATGAYAAALARAARSPVLQALDPALAGELRGRAVAAWGFLLAHSAQPDDFDDWHHYGVRYGSLDERAWAGVELYALTGEDEYHQAFLRYHQPEEKFWSWVELPGSFGFATRSVALWGSQDPPLDADMKARCHQAFRGAADHYVSDAERTPYGLVVDGAIKRWHQVGWYFPVADHGYDLLLAHSLYGDQRYRETALDQLHYTLGANPANISYVTGLGYKRLRTSVDQETLHDGIEAPVPGLPVSPLVSGFYWLNGYGHDLGKHTYPPDNADGQVYGLLDQSYEGWNVKAEFVIDQLASMVGVVALLTPVADVPAVHPTIALNVEQTGARISPSLSFSGVVPAGYSVLWRANGKPVSFDPQFAFDQSYDDPVHLLGVEVTTDAGLRAYAEVRINTRNYADLSIPLEPLGVDDTVVALFHLDGDGADATGRQADLNVEAQATFDQGNLFWMARPAGSALRVNGRGDQASLDIPTARLLDRGDLRRIVVEGLVYIDDLPRRGAQRGNILALVSRWDVQMRLSQGGWAADTSVTLGRSQRELAIETQLPLHRWHLVRLEVDGDGYSLHVDGIVVVEEAVDRAIDTWRTTSPITLSFGNFTGWVDEVRVRVETETSPNAAGELLRDDFHGPDGEAIDTDTSVRWLAGASGSHAHYAGGRGEVARWRQLLSRQTFENDGWTTVHFAARFQGLGTMSVVEVSGQAVTSSFGVRVSYDGAAGLTVVSNNLGYAPQTLQTQVAVVSSSGEIEVTIERQGRDVVVVLSDDQGRREVARHLDNGRFDLPSSMRLGLGEGSYDELRVWRD